MMEVQLCSSMCFVRSPDSQMDSRASRTVTLPLQAEEVYSSPLHFKHQQHSSTRRLLLDHQLRPGLFARHRVHLRSRRSRSWPSSISPFLKFAESGDHADGGVMTAKLLLGDRFWECHHCLNQASLYPEAYRSSSL